MSGYEIRNGRLDVKGFHELTRDNVAELRKLLNWRSDIEKEGKRDVEAENLRADAQRMIDERERRR